MAKEFRIDPKLLDELLKDQDPKQVLLTGLPAFFGPVLELV